MRELNRQEIIDILNGCTVLGTGGGGELAEGIAYIDEALALGKRFRLIEISEVPAGSILCTPYMLGAISPLSDAQEELYSQLVRNNSHSIISAYKRMKAYIDKDIYGTICCELGGSNTAISFYLAAMFDGFIIDADPAGRAVPEITHSTYFLNDLPASPIITANEFGECFICENIKDDQRAESVVRALAKVSRNDIAAIDHILPVEQLSSALIHGTISKALRLGQIMSQSYAQQLSVANAIAKQENGKLEFEGKVTHFEFETLDGFTMGQFSLSGINTFYGQRYQVDVKNENMLGRLNGKIQVTIPDLICAIDIDKGMPITNPNFVNGMNVSIIILPAPEAFLTKRGLSIFGPRYAGIDADYVKPN